MKPSFPTRRFSDLLGQCDRRSHFFLRRCFKVQRVDPRQWDVAAVAAPDTDRIDPWRPCKVGSRRRGVSPAGIASQRNLEDSSSRSEEHTSALQSLMRNSYAVFCLNKITHLF